MQITTNEITPHVCHKYIAAFYAFIKIIKMACHSEVSFTVQLSCVCTLSLSRRRRCREYGRKYNEFMIFNGIIYDCK